MQEEERWGKMRGKKEKEREGRTNVENTAKGEEQQVDLVRTTKVRGSELRRESLVGRMEVQREREREREIDRQTDR